MCSSFCNRPHDVLLSHRRRLAEAQDDLPERDHNSSNWEIETRNCIWIFRRSQMKNADLYPSLSLNQPSSSVQVCSVECQILSRPATAAILHAGRGPGVMVVGEPGGNMLSRARAATGRGGVRPSGLGWEDAGKVGAPRAGNSCGAAGPGSAGRPSRRRLGDPPRTKWLNPIGDQ